MWNSLIVKLKNGIILGVGNNVEIPHVECGK